MATIRSRVEKLEAERGKNVAGIDCVLVTFVRPGKVSAEPTAAQSLDGAWTLQRQARESAGAFEDRAVKHATKLRTGTAPAVVMMTVGRDGTAAH